LVTRAAPVSSRILPSGRSRPASIACLSSGIWICALVIAIVGLMSQPSASRSAKTSATKWPQGSSETILSALAHCGCGPNVSTGAVFVRSGTWIGLSLPAVIASAR
jgi:hypothetical protein